MIVFAGPTDKDSPPHLSLNSQAWIGFDWIGAQLMWQKEQKASTVSTVSCSFFGLQSCSKENQKKETSVLHLQATREKCALLYVHQVHGACDLSFINHLHRHANITISLCNSVGKLTASRRPSEVACSISSLPQISTRNNQHRRNANEIKRKTDAWGIHNSHFWFATSIFSP